ncbi:MAG: hypothetical protein AAF449_05120 [Myxococcota bacterium]
MNVRRYVQIGFAALTMIFVATACAEPSQPSASSASEATAKAPGATAGEAVPAAKPTSLGDTEPAKATSEPTGAVPLRLPVEADFEEEADVQITEKTYKSELDALEQAIATDSE